MSNNKIDKKNPKKIKKKKKKEQSPTKFKMTIPAL
jgi:hypothetical protein